MYDGVSFGDDIKLHSKYSGLCCELKSLKLKVLPGLTHSVVSFIPNCQVMARGAVVVEFAVVVGVAVAVVVAVVFVEVVGVAVVFVGVVGDAVVFVGVVAVVFVGVVGVAVVVGVDLK